MANMKKYTIIAVKFSDMDSEYNFEDQFYFLGQNNKLVEHDLKNARVFTQEDMPEMDIIFKYELKEEFIKLNPQYKNLTTFDLDVTISPTTYKIG
jgi:hypothetical protein